MRKFLVRVSHPFLRRWYAWWSRKPRRFRADGLDLIVLPGVFHPGLFFSTALLSEHIASLDLNGKSFLELGAGTGRIALIAARNGAHVTASDINSAAIGNLTLNSQRNGLPITVAMSDLFEALPQHFDVIAINPPYYPKEPMTDADKAFYSGGGHDYYARLFPQLAKRIERGSAVYIVLSEDVDRAPIVELARRSGLHFAPQRNRRYWGETQTVFSIDPVGSIGRRG